MLFYDFNKTDGNESSTFENDDKKSIRVKNWRIVIELIRNASVSIIDYYY